MGNKENNKLTTRNYGLSVPCELLFLSSCRLIQISTKDAYLFVSVTLICLVLCLKKDNFIKNVYVVLSSLTK